MCQAQLQFLDPGWAKDWNQGLKPKHALDSESSDWKAPFRFDRARDDVFFLVYLVGCIACTCAHGLSQCLPQSFRRR